MITIISDKEAIESLKTLSDYALQHNNCEGCIFKPKDYEPIKNECLFRYGCIIDYYINFKNSN